MSRDTNDILRIIDANRNRSLEALRVLEDAARFALDSEPLSHKAKEMRHGLAAAIEPFSSRLPAARRIESDVGTGVSVESERGRESVSQVVKINSSRLKESLRVIEEYAKILDPAAGEALQNIRYEFYSFERRLLKAFFPAGRLREAVLCAIVSSGDPNGPLETARLAVEGGADIIQLREKGVPDRRFLETAVALRRLTSDNETIFIVNDRADIASASGADGVHVGPDDLPAAEARRLLDPDAIMGASAHSIEEAVSAEADGADYLGVGSLFPTSTKKDAIVRGPGHFMAIQQVVNIPCFAVGGIMAENITEAVRAGVGRAAVASGISHAKDPKQAVQKIKAILLQHSSFTTENTENTEKNKK